MSEKNVSIIIEEYIRANGFDGLVNPEIECGCPVDEGLFPCDSVCPECQPGYKGKSNDPDYEYMMFVDKPTDEPEEGEDEG
ncbi:hypothetical protein [Candidatus Magnetobacterium casense]|uniref:Uncharacterized protein n=1 Tax=Candidatus Magnetobacterium casense TaxID=1455061 RepID=A0ABS6S196_9BACT|nr:hypothetical protein [Candidatus Magnetobacterium casensis]MBV6342412.1 hypothetical protein [Candidatus Magnetobacterium casensis]